MKSKQVLERIIENVEESEAYIDEKLNQIRRPYLESWLLPLTVGTTLSLEAAHLAKLAEKEIMQYEPLIRSFVGEAYPFLQSIISYGVLTGSIVCGVLPITLALHRHYRLKNLKHYDSLSAKADRVLEHFYKVAKKKISKNEYLNNKVTRGMVHAVNNGVTLTGLNLLGMEAFAYENITKFPSLTSLSTGILAGIIGIKTSQDIYDYFKERQPVVPLKNRWQAKVPLIYALSALSLANSVQQTGLPEFRLVSIKIIEDAVKIESREKISEPKKYEITQDGKMNYWNAAAYFAEMYSDDKVTLDPDFLRAVFFVESGFKHFKGRNVLVSKDKAYGLGQQTEGNIKTLNSEIKIGNLKGDLFKWEEVIKKPEENIRATVASFRRLISQCETNTSCLEETLAKYNAGEGSVAKAKEKVENDNFWIYGKLLPRAKETDLFVRSVMIYYYFLKEEIAWPTTNTKINSRYGLREGEQHNGIDIAPRIKGVSGDDIYAIASGVVTETAKNNGNGVYVKINHADPNLKLYSTYLHGLHKSIQVKEGDEVERGEQIMQMGSTGKSTGVHLDLRISVESLGKTYFFNPLSFYSFARGEFGSREYILVKLPKEK